jgi:putative transposase
VASPTDNGGMPRTGRAAVGGYCYHVVNRGNRRAEVFHGADDYAAFARLLRQASAHAPMRVLGWCLMPNHFHAVLWPEGDDDLAAWMHWLLTTHAVRYNRRYDLKGHVWQGRFSAFPIQQDDHLLTVLRYAERNPLRANLVASARDWLWSSLAERLRPPLLPLLHPGPVSLPGDWADHVDRPQTEAELRRLRQAVRRGCPYGSDPWTQETAVRLGLESTLRPQGRPRKGIQPVADQRGLFDPP